MYIVKILKFILILSVQREYFDLFYKYIRGESSELKIFYLY